MKSIEQVRQMKQSLIKELKMLPETNAFGGSNNLDREQIQGWIVDLVYIENFGSPPDYDSDVSLWFLEESFSPLCDYEESCQDFTEYEQLLRYAVWLNL